MKALPELLAPAGSPLALEAAVAAGADAVYFGGPTHNARIGAKNFDRDSMRSSVALAHAHGVKCYITLNTLASDRELTEVLSAAADAYNAGIDAAIVADLGLASRLHAYLSDLALHASTQASGHNIYAAAELKKLGFLRMVMAREATLRDIRHFTESSSLELEVFVHGALCVSHSGQCLFSSLVGGRSGNRGECAQPCRLPLYKGGREYYPLSLKDLCLASYVPDLIDSGVASLKIEGRMKPPEYVFGVVSVWRKLLDERRAATPDELRFLAECFSRSGFTDGYFTERIGRSMLGVRSEADKTKTRALSPFEGIKTRVPIDIFAKIKDSEPTELTLSTDKGSVTVLGDPPLVAQNAPMTADDYSAKLSKLGATPYVARRVVVDCDDGLMVPVSRLNALRREAIEKLDAVGRLAPTEFSTPQRPHGRRKAAKTARFALPEQITDAAREYFDTIYLPLEHYDGSVSGVVLPPVVFDHELYRVEKLLERAVELGAKDALVGNLGHIELAKRHGLTLHGDFRLNAFNTDSVAALERCGVVDVILSPELTLPQLRDISGDTSAIVYGRIPLMTLEKCVICEASGCPGRGGDQNCRAEIVDRRGVAFPVMREGEHRNVIVNSLPTSMSDKQTDLTRAGITDLHFIFTVEAPKEIDRVVDAFKTGRPLDVRVRRI